jgi:hypothetical protein
MALENLNLEHKWAPEDIPVVKARSASDADKLTAICEPIIWKLWGPRHRTTL